jgi:hydrogenase maturation protease
MKTLVIGCGNLLRSDDGIGIHVIEHLRRERSVPGIDLVEAVSGIDIIGAIQGYEKVILVDAIQSGGTPGTVYEFSLSELGEAGTFSSHGMDFASLMKLGRGLYPGQIPDKITVLAVEAEDVMTISDKCTPKVAEAVSRVIGKIKSIAVS